MRTIAAWILGLAAIFVGFDLAARLQHWDNATLIAECGQPKECVYKGAISRQFFTGAYEVAQPDGSTMVVPKSQWRAMSWTGGSLSWTSVLAGIAGLGVFAVLTLGDALEKLRRALRKEGWQHHPSCVARQTHIESAQ